MYPQSMFCAKIKKNIKIFHLKIDIFTAVKYRCILHGHVFLMKWLEILDFGSRRDCTICVGKTKGLLSCVCTVQQLICVFVFAYDKSKYSHDVAHIIVRFCT